VFGVLVGDVQFGQGRAKVGGEDDDGGTEFRAGTGGGGGDWHGSPVLGKWLLWQGVGWRHRLVGRAGWAAKLLK
jgi:hypothetical protein